MHAWKQLNIAFRCSRVDGDHAVRGHGSHELLQVPHIRVPGDMVDLERHSTL